MIKETLRQVTRLLPKVIQNNFMRQTVCVGHAKMTKGYRGNYVEVMGEYHEETGKIFLYNVQNTTLSEKELFYCYAHECGHKYLSEYINGSKLKELFGLMSAWNIHDNEYIEYQVVRKIAEIFCDVFAFFLRMKYYAKIGMSKKVAKIKRVLNKKAPGSISFLESAFKHAHINSKKINSNTYPVTIEDLVRIKKIFGSDLL